MMRKWTYLYVMWRLLLPELALTDIEPTYGKYGMLRKSYLQEHRKAKYQILLLQGKLVEHLNQIDAEARDREEQLVKQMMEKEGITEELKGKTTWNGQGG